MPEKTEELNIYQKLAKVRKSVEVLQRNKSGYGYKYVSEDEILSKITGLMDKYGISLLPGIVPGTTTVTPYSYKKTKVQAKTNTVYEENVNEIIVRADTVYTWVNNNNPEEKVVVPWSLVGQQADASQSFGSGLSYTFRYFLLKYFDVSTPEDSVDEWRSKQQQAEEAEEKAIVDELIGTLDVLIKDFISSNPDKIDDVKKFCTKYVKSGDYFKIGDQVMASKILADFNNTFLAFNGFDTLLAPFIKNDNLSYTEVKQAMQNFIFSVNSNSRCGAEPAFFNLTFDLTPPKDMLDEYCVIGGELVSFTYGSCQREMDLLNRVFYEIMLEGDAAGKLFAYPIPTYNIHSRFDWDNPNNKLLWEMAGKYGTPYFANFINSDLDINDVRSMCCRLRLDLSELRHRNGGLFGAGDSTGSIGVVTLNLPRIAYESGGDVGKFYEELDKYLCIAKDSLEIKRSWLQENIIDTGAIPAYIEYVGTIDNHFSTIGVVGMNEMCENFMGKNILDEEAHKFCVEVGEYIRNKLLVFQEETGHLYNYEATPAESTCYRLALHDKKDYPDIITQGDGKNVYYTNSCHIPVKYIKDIDSTFAHQDDLQTQFTGGTVIHCWLEGAIPGEHAKQIIKSMFEKYRVPYMSLSPISRYCDEHGYVKEHVDKCPICGRRVKKYQRITGYLRCVDNFNPGKAAEFKDRVQL